MREAQNDILSFFKIKKEHNRELLPLYIIRWKQQAVMHHYFWLFSETDGLFSLTVLLFSLTVLLLTLDVSDDVALLDL